MVKPAATCEAGGMISSTHAGSRKRLTAAQRRQLLTRYHQSSLTQAQFAACHGVGLSTLGKWLARARNGSATPPVRFQEVGLPGATARWAAELVSPRGWTVRLAQIPQEVENLQSLLGALPC